MDSIERLQKVLTAIDDTVSKAEFETVITTLMGVLADAKEALTNEQQETLKDLTTSLNVFAQKLDTQNKSELAEIKEELTTKVQKAIDKIPDIEQRLQIAISLAESVEAPSVDYDAVYSYVDETIKELIPEQKAETIRDALESLEGEDRLSYTAIKGIDEVLSEVKKSRTVYVGSVNSGSGTGVSDHGALTGLSDDDHTQYHNDARGDARYSQLGHTHTASQVTDFDTEVSNNTDVAANTAARHTHSNQAVLDSTTASFTTADETKLDGIEAGADVTDATNVAAAGAFMKSSDDTDDITEGATKKFATAAEKTKLGYITVTQAVDLDTLESDTATNNAKVSNATHTGDVTGATTLTIDKTAITGKTAVTAVGTDYVLISDTSDTGNLKKALVSDLTGSVSTSWGSITGTLSSQTDLQTALDGKVDENSAITGATKTKITYDTKGLVTAGADATTADIADSTNRRYVTDAQQTVIGNTSGTNTGDITLAGTPNYITLAGQVLTRALIDLASHVTGKLPFANVADVATSTVMYRKTAGTGSMEAQTLSTLKTDLGLTGTNSGDQTSIVGITGTKAQFDTAVTDGNFLYVGDVTQYTDEQAQDAVGAMVDSTIVYTDGTPLLSRAALTGDVTASAGSNVLAIDKTAITGKTTVTAVGTDYVMISDTSDSGNLKKALVSDFTGGGSYTDEQAQDAVGTILTSGGNVSLTYDDATPAISANMDDNASTQNVDTKENGGTAVSGATALDFVDSATITASVSNNSGEAQISFNLVGGNGLTRGQANMIRLGAAF